MDAFPHRDQHLVGWRDRGPGRIIPDGLDADTSWYRESSPDVPELTVTGRSFGKLYGPDGANYREVPLRPTVPFGFQLPRLREGHNDA